MKEQVGGRHRDLHPGFVKRAAKAADDRIALGGRNAHRDQIVIVQVHAVGAELGQPMNRNDGIERGTNLIAERVAARFPTVHSPNVK